MIQKQESGKLVGVEEEAEDKIITDDDDESELTPRTLNRKMKKAGRQGVSAEVYGENNSKEEFVPRVDEQAKLEYPEI